MYYYATKFTLDLWFQGIPQKGLPPFITIFVSARCKEIENLQEIEIPPWPFEICSQKIGQAMRPIWHWFHILGNATTSYFHSETSWPVCLILYICFCVQSLILKYPCMYGLCSFIIRNFTEYALLSYGASASTKIQQTKIAVEKFSSLFKAEPVYEGRLKVILLLQASSHDFEPTFIIFCLNWRILPDQPK